ncbi:glycosyltransferase [Flagellimonas zhangzhouensis]|uniref:Glycosyltransferase, catalytic subunit of cellulose synthase and poly-beta-1,6-N-acetylglucosamine synthase n=1 Tax=Flagellimonas zhangzhouensis TaxID=1073328 RepID=A0A1H2S0V1_9FLAO|nr:glycosyltransferase [Allomuricauda zhangzhouensis]SDQ69466.1 Glycosyltransferase, catalytic subunit of cellulose synthase and poly-beta-1,6-N-acetylglucosamine synthase [Allomuricauda zhangzhouensis]SDW25228.1 Glycosyltransferase, catalytic subunit of cellulose synthase and poly-beta-1,6-N-acetylglucosamine synthase [Allomuricauda zhangzhouensis]
MNRYFSIVVPVYNRPDEVRELLESLQKQDFQKEFEVVIVEDGSSESSEEVVKSYQNTLQISYYFKANSGPGDSRNFGMEKAKGDYYIILDSDCILPPQYLSEVEKELQREFVYCFGGPDAADQSFTTVQKAINYVMTSFFTTGGIRGGKKAVGKFQPRSFNMGISKEAFEKAGGFGRIHPGEDPDLTFRIWKAGFETRLFPNAFVYHKRRIDWNKFYIQVNKFGMVRPILNRWHKGTAKPTYWFPTLFMLGLIMALLLALVGIGLPLWLYGCYFVLLFVDAFLKTKNVAVAVLSLFAALTQFTGYGIGFIKSTMLLNFSKKEPEELFPKLFFKKK